MTKTTHTINSHDDVTSYNTPWGVRYDTYLFENSSTRTYYTSDYLRVGDDNTGDDPDYTILFKLYMPDEPISGAEVDYVTVRFNIVGNTSIAASPSNAIFATVYPLDIDYEASYASWEYRKSGIEWTKHGGDFTAEDSNAVDGASKGYAYIAYTDSTNWTWLQYQFDDENLDWGDVKSYAIQHNKNDADWHMSFGSNRIAGTRKPKITMAYTVDDPDAFKNDSDKLKIEPNPANKTQVLCKWGGSDDTKFTNYKIYRWADGNAERSTTLTTITDAGNVEHIDTLATTPDAVYYYQAAVTLTDDMSNTVTTYSNAVQFWRPKGASFTVTSTSPPAWSTVTGTITGSVSNKPGSRTTTKFIYDWEGDASAEQIRNLASNSTSDNTTHVYTASGSITPRCKIESDQGFQSNYTSASAVTVAGLSPIGVVKGPTYCAKNTAYTFRGDESYDQNTDGTVEHWGWDWEYSSPFTSNVSTTIPTASHTYTSTGDKTLALRVWDDDGNNSGSITMTLEVYDNTPTVLDLSDSTRVSAREIDDGENIFSTNLYLGTEYGEIIWTGKDFPAFTLNGWTDKDADGMDDIELLEDYSDTPTRLKLWVSENKKWYIGFMTNFSKSYKGGEVNQYFWNAQFICDAKE